MRNRTPTCMCEDLGLHYTSKGEVIVITHQPIQHRACKEQLGAFMATRLDISIALDFFVQEELEGPIGSSRVVIERQTLALVWSYAYIICSWVF